MSLNVVASILCLLSIASIAHAVCYGWGKNDQGQLGIGHQTSIFIPTSIPFYANVPVIDVLTAANYHMGLLENKSVVASGFQYYGQFALGYVSTAAILTPIICPALNTSLDITLPGTSCNANMLSNLLGWGNLAGYVQKRDTGAFPRVQVALPVYGFDGKVLSVNSVMEGVLVRLANNTVWAAGNNVNGRLGNGKTTTTTSFVEVPFWKTVPLRQLYSSQSPHACGLAVNGSLFCWGKNSYGQLGVGDLVDKSTPTRVRFFDDEAHLVYKVSYGDSFTAVLTCGGRVFAFGANQFGQLGQAGSDSTTHAKPVEVPISIVNSTVVDIVTGFSQTYIRADDNKWYAWGAGASGTLGFGPTNNVFSPTYHPLITDKKITRIRSSSQSFNFFGWTEQYVSNIRSGCPVLVDECIAKSHDCAENAYCSNKERGYICTCSPGWIGDGYINGSACINMYSCAAQNQQNDLCVPEVPCDDSSGVASCFCPPGYNGDGKRNGTGCYDINECEQGNPCAANALCTNLAPSYNCTCSSGYVGDPVVDGCSIVCLPGQYATNRTNCDSCPPGTFTDVPGAENCFPCPGGTYNTEWGSDSRTDCLKCPIGGYSEPKATYCSLCVHGYSNDPEQERIDNSTCYPCPLGTYGYYGVCYPCDTGKFSIDAVAKQCRNCPPGYVNTQSASLSCEKCPAGTSTRGGTTNCAACPAGTYSFAGSKDCLKCPLGTSTNGLTNQTSCSSCSAGYYNSKAGSPSCSPCQAGTFASGPAAVTCQRCPQGTFAESTGSSACASCSAGSIASSSASLKCSACDSLSTSVDGISCTPCNAGQYLDSATRTCKPCAPGTFVAVTGVSACYACAPGTYASGFGSTYCKRCDVNTFSNAANGYASCTACPAGKTSGGGASVCA